VHNAILECATVHYSYYTKNIINDLESMLKTDSNTRMQGSNAENNAWRQRLNNTMSMKQRKVYRRNASTLVI